jgi:hypothetical protein
MYNINMGHNAKLMEQCDTLQGYALLIMKIREYQEKGMSLEEATDCACQYCIEHNVLREFLLKNRNEVRRVLLTEYNAKHQRKLDRRDAWEEGREQEKEQIILKMYYKGYTLEQIADITDKQVEEVRTIIENNP